MHPITSSTSFTSLSPPTYTLEWNTYGRSAQRVYYNKCKKMRKYNPATYFSAFIRRRMLIISTCAMICIRKVFIYKRKQQQKIKDEETKYRPNIEVINMAMYRMYSNIIHIVWNTATQYFSISSMQESETMSATNEKDIKNSWVLMMAAAAVVLASVLFVFFLCILASDNRCEWRQFAYLVHKMAKACFYVRSCHGHSRTMWQYAARYNYYKYGGAAKFSAAFFSYCFSIFIFVNCVCRSYIFLQCGIWFAAAPD